MSTRVRVKNVFTFFQLNQRQKSVVVLVIVSLLLTSVVLSGLFLSSERIASHLELRNLAPSFAHPFGTDWLGRDMLTRTFKGLTLSIAVGLIAATASVMIAFVLGVLAATMGRVVDGIISWLVDLFLSVPHLVILILIAFATGGGVKGVIIGLALTHWPSLTRVIRAEVMQIRSAEYVEISKRLGKSRWFIARKHLLPHIIPQLFVGLFLLFPHAILHEAAITFLGMGLSPHQPAIGIILSESMRYLSTGMWWLAVFPGLSLLIIVRSFDILGERLRMLLNPHEAHK
ncbi:ABC transporter permease [Halalkalibacter krulwichiae]|uniref:Dipeptide transport system permease protein DppC n=1 Tax=Halalkalibacter krulwichiae TaxID=199441 RepID=A0A1X9MCT2_9BACI|nr:ABC transporter permease [Halalkalibacter krulwichiae]ARK31245.1 Dipeptide transport system permease protein DppC [Halalkalibacter krulwichiae]